MLPKDCHTKKFKYTGSTYITVRTNKILCVWFIQKVVYQPRGIDSREVLSFSNILTESKTISGTCIFWAKAFIM